MSAWLRKSFAEWLKELSVRPLLLVLEDLHWGDLLSAAYLGDALRMLANQPLMVLALARPEIHAAFPELWSGTEKLDLALGRLAPRAAERLVRIALGEALAADAVSSIVGRADGNPFYLEELIRCVADGRGGSLPDTVLALAQSRLERLDPDARRIVRAGSVFGEVFWRAGVLALVSAQASAGDVDAQLERLVRGEVLVEMHESRFPGDQEYTFRHGLLRDAAYAMLTEADRATGHLIAGDWLEQAGEKEPLTLADHFDLGKQPKRAAPWLVRAARAALHGGNPRATLQLGRRAITCGAEGPERGALGLFQVTALYHLGDLVGAVACGREALEFLPAGTPLWCLCATHVFTLGALSGNPDLEAPVLEELSNLPAEKTQSGIYGYAVCLACMGLTAVGATELARSIVERAQSTKLGDSNGVSTFVVGLRVGRAYLGLFTGQLSDALRDLAEARALTERWHELRGSSSAWQQMVGAASYLLVAALAEAGDCEQAQAAAAQLREFCGPAGMHLYSDRVAESAASAMLHARRSDEAIELLRPLIDRPDRHLALSAQARLAHALIAIGDLDAAESAANAAIEHGAVFPSTRPAGLGALALVALRRRQAEQALSFAERGLEAEAHGSWLGDGSILRLARAEALDALGRTRDAHATIADARDRILRIAATLDDLRLRETYTTNIEANSRTLLLARDWLEDETAAG
jgi:tetratricopeptide (TPR) repeat protein